ncbi:MAG: DUF397 domain-containing protein [Pseudonocardia sp.]
MINRDAGQPAWLTSSQNNASCVQVQFDGNMVLVRDSKDPDGPVHSMSRSQFAAFLGEVVHGLPSNNGAVEVTCDERVVQFPGRNNPEITKWHVRSVDTGEQHYRDDEWLAFQDGARAGTFGEIAELATS